MVSPLTAAFDVDTEGIDRHVAYLIEAGVSGVFVLGTSGEGPWLTPAQGQSLIERSVLAAAGRVPVLVGVLEPSTPRVIEAIRRAADSGASAIVATTPYYLEADADSQRGHFETIALQSPLPLVLYNIPSKTQNVLATETVAQLMADERILGIKDSADDWPSFKALLDLRQKRPDFKVLQGAERGSARALLAGADGLVAGLGNVAPELFVRMLALVKSGDEAGVQKLQAQVDGLWHIHTHGFWLGCLKYAASLRGHCSSTVTGENGGLPEVAQTAIRELVTQYGGQG
jgi:4-hydroxy-tetrahydrodipicolinate synthase